MQKKIDTNPMKYRAEIDGLRALAVIPVILFHAGFELFSGGYVGVDVFFVISGYLITSILIFDLNNKNFSLFYFYERRARRILPALFFVFFICLPFAWASLIPSALKEFSESLIASSLFVSNIFFWKNIGYFDSAVELKPLIHTWSLAVEEQFYIFFPLLLIVIWRLGVSITIAIIITILICSLSLAEWGSLYKPGASFYLIPMRTWELLIGSLSAFYTQSLNRDYQENKYSQGLSILGVLFIAYAVFSYDKTTPFPGLHAVLPTFGTALILIFSNNKTIIGSLLSSKPLVFIGVISYSIYLWHQPIFSFARTLNVDEPSKILMGSLSALTILAGFLTWYFIEKPFRTYAHFSRRSVFLSCIFGSLLFVVIGCIGILTNGFLFRYKESDKYLASINNIESGKYTQKLFNEHLMKKFDQNVMKRKILIIGDSFGQDLINSLNENDYLNHFQISTREIGSGCGNLFIDRRDLISKILDSKEKILCLRDISVELFTDQDLILLMLSADEIWFASNWKLWQAELISESINNVYLLSGKEIKIFGKKDLGEISIINLLRKNYAERIIFNGRPSPETYEINSILKRNISQTSVATFIDTQKVLCQNPENCRLFTDSGKLISYDGKHLTRFGAKLLGENLKAELAH